MLFEFLYNYGDFPDYAHTDDMRGCPPDTEEPDRFKYAIR